MPVSEARQWIAQLAAKPEATRAVIRATAVLGDPHAVDWLVGQMRVAALTRLAGEAFSTITGIDLDEQGLALEGLPDLDKMLPNDDPADDYVAMDEEENLPFPDAAKVAAVWQKYQNRFTSGKRYLLGKPITPDHLNQTLTQGFQRQRHAAAIELALIEKGSILVNTRAAIVGMD